MREKSRSQWKNAFACSVSDACWRPSSRITSCVQVSRVVHSGQRSLTTRGPETASVWATAIQAPNKRRSKRVFIYNRIASEAEPLASIIGWPGSTEAATEAVTAPELALAVVRGARALAASTRLSAARVIPATWTFVIWHPFTRELRPAPRLRPHSRKGRAERDMLSAHDPLVR